jgi:hypothetical protein
MGNTLERVRAKEGETVDDGEYGRHTISENNYGIYHNDKSHAVELSLSQNGSNQDNGFFTLNAGTSDKWYRDRTKKVHFSLKRNGKVYHQGTFVPTGNPPYYNISTLEKM